MPYCKCCGKTMDEKQFYRSHRLDRYPPEGIMDTCKKCLTMSLDNFDSRTYLPILEAIDIPYIKEAWDGLLTKYKDNPDKLVGTTVLGRYISKMKLNQYATLRWDDTERIAEEAKQTLIKSMRAQGYDDDEISAAVAKGEKPVEKPASLAAPQEAVGEAQYLDPEQTTDEVSESLTEEDKTMLTLKWGRGYTWSQKVRMEQLYQDFMKSYDINTAGGKDTLIMVCKTSLKANELLDAGDVEGFQKMQKAYDSLMKSGKWQPAQAKGAEGDEYVDCISDLVLLCEKEGFIPRYYVDKPQDKVDQTLADYKHYLHSLVTEELNLGSMIESSLRAIAQDKAREAIIDVEDEDEEAVQEDAIMDYDAPVLTNQDFSDFEDKIAAEREEDKGVV